MILNDLKSPKIRVLVNFLQFLAATHFNSELRQNGWRWTWTTCAWHF